MKNATRKPSKTTPIEPPRSALKRRRGQPVTKITASVSPQLARAVRVRAATQGRTVSDVVSEALERAEREAGQDTR